MGKKNRPRDRGTPLNMGALSVPGHLHPDAENEKRWIVSAFMDKATVLTPPLLLGTWCNDWDGTLDELVTHMGPECTKAAVPAALRALVAEGIVTEIPGTPTRYRCALECAEHRRYVIQHHDYDWPAHLTRTCPPGRPG
jgi:hypothetical protein